METNTNFHWSCKHTWKRSAINTAWCLLGCAIGDFGTIFFFHYVDAGYNKVGMPDPKNITMMNEFFKFLWSW